MCTEVRDGQNGGRQRIRSRVCGDSRESDVGLELMNCEIMTQTKVDAQPTEPPRIPNLKVLYGSWSHFDYSILC